MFLFVIVSGEGDDEITPPPGFHLPNQAQAQDEAAEAAAPAAETPAVADGCTGAGRPPKYEPFAL